MPLNLLTHETRNIIQEPVSVENLRCFRFNPTFLHNIQTRQANSSDMIGERTLQRLSNVSEETKENVVDMIIKDAVYFHWYICPIEGLREGSGNV